MAAKFIIFAAFVAVASASGGSYTFNYGVSDPNTGDVKSQNEKRVSDSVVGQYSVFDPDGTKRSVEYESHPQTGINAIVGKNPPYGIHPSPAEYGYGNPLAKGALANPALASLVNPVLAPLTNPALTHGALANPLLNGALANPLFHGGSANPLAYGALANPLYHGASANPLVNSIVAPLAHASLGSLANPAFAPLAHGAIAPFAAGVAPFAAGDAPLAHGALVNPQAPGAVAPLAGSLVGYGGLTALADPAEGTLEGATALSASTGRAISFNNQKRYPGYGAGYRRYSVGYSDYGAGYGYGGACEAGHGPHAAIAPGGAPLAPGAYVGARGLELRW